MEITACTVFEKLGRTFGSACAIPAADQPVRMVLFPDGSSQKGDALYITSAEETADWDRSWDTQAVVCVGEPPHRERRAEHWMVLPEGTPIPLAFNRVQGILSDFARWREDVEAAWDDAHSLQAVLSAGAAYLGLSMCLVDSDYRYVAHTRDFLRRHPEWKQGRMPLESVNRLLLEPQFLRAKEADGPFLYGDASLCYNIKVEGVYQARLLAESESRTYTPSDMALMSAFGQRLTAFYTALLHTRRRREEDDAFYAVMEDLLAGRSCGQARLKEALALRGWQPDQEYQVIQLRFIGQEVVEQSKDFYCDQLERMFPGSCCLRRLPGIVWILNRSLSAGVPFPGQLPYFLRESLCRAGISNLLRGLGDLAAQYRQAQLALEIGLEKHGTFWYHKFSDYRFDYLLGQCCREFPPRQVCHGALLTLLDYDQREHAELFHTLSVYLAADGSATEAARRLYIHRTTLLSRIQRITALTGLDLKDRDTVLFLLLSYRLLEEAAGDRPQ